MIMCNFFKVVKKYISLLMLLSIFLVSCNGDAHKQTNDEKINDFKPPLPPGYREQQEQAYCDSLKARTYATLQQGTVELVTKDFSFHDVDKEELFKEILKKRFKLKLLPIYDSVHYPKCIMPIMDSAIVSKYGPKGKDSIIKWINHYVDSFFSSGKTIKKRLVQGVKTGNN
jgi:hypothetical protein